MRALVNDLGNLVQKVCEVSFKHFSVIRVLIDLANHKDCVNLLARYHDFQVAFTRTELVTNYDRAELTK